MWQQNAAFSGVVAPFILLQTLETTCKKILFIDKHVCNDASALCSLFLLRPNLSCFQVIEIINFYFGICKVSTHEISTDTTGFPRHCVPTEATWIYLPWVPVCCTGLFFIANKDHERSLSSAGPVLNMKKLHSHFCALLKQLLSYPFVKSRFLSSQSSHTKPHFPFMERKKLIELSTPNPFLSSVCLPVKKSRGA